MKRQLDQALDNLQAKKDALAVQFKGEMAGIDAAIVALREQRANRPVRRKRAPKPSEDAQPSFRS